MRKKIPVEILREKVYPLANPKAGGPGIWSAFDAIKDVRDSKEWGTKVTSGRLKIFSDIKAGSFPRFRG